jgi:hypothetical protein
LGVLKGELVGGFLDGVIVQVVWLAVHSVHEIAFEVLREFLLWKTFSDALLDSGDFLSKFDLSPANELIE